MLMMPMRSPGRGGKLSPLFICLFFEPVFEQPPHKVSRPALITPLGRRRAVADSGSVWTLVKATEARRLAAGDMEGEAVWLRIVKAIEELLSEERPDDAEVH